MLLPILFYQHQLFKEEKVPTGFLMSCNRRDFSRHHLRPQCLLPDYASVQFFFQMQ
jgi:hypothetical protein